MAAPGSGLLQQRTAESGYRVSADSGMWISKPIYESLPYFYLIVGAVTLAASMYMNHWYWPSICFSVGLLGLVSGLVVLLKRRDYRSDERRTDVLDGF